MSSAQLCVRPELLSGIHHKPFPAPIAHFKKYANDAHDGGGGGGVGGTSGGSDRAPVLLLRSRPREDSYRISVPLDGSPDGYLVSSRLSFTGRGSAVPRSSLGGDISTVRDIDHDGGADGDGFEPLPLYPPVRSGGDEDMDFIPLRTSGQWNEIVTVTL